MHDVPCLRALVHTSVSGALRANLRNPWHICLMFHACEHLSTLPFRGRYEQAWKKPWHIVTFHAVHTSVSGALRANLKNQNIWWRSMLASTCPHFRFGGAASKLEKTKHMTFHAYEHSHLSTLPFRGCYEQTWKNMTYDGPCLRELVHTSVSRALRANLKKHEIWRSMLASTCPHFRFGGSTSKLEKHDVWWRSMLASTCSLFFVSGALRANLKKHDIWRSMVASTCSLFFLFRGRCAQTWKTWQRTFHACEHLSTPRRTMKQAVQFGESTGHLSDLSKDHICVYMHIYIYLDRSIDYQVFGLPGWMDMMDVFFFIFFHRKASNKQFFACGEGIFFDVP